MDSDKRKRRNMWRVVFVIYLIFLMYFLFFSDLFGRTVVYEDYRYNLEPFKEIKRFCTTVKDKDYLIFFVNIIGNIVLFMPFGYLFMAVTEGRQYRHKKIVTGFLDAFVAAFIFCLTVETAQLLSKVGVFDVDDVILNVFGAILGYFVYVIARRVRTATRNREYERNEEKERKQCSIQKKRVFR